MQCTLPALALCMNALVLLELNRSFELNAEGSPIARTCTVLLSLNQQARFYAARSNRTPLHILI